MASTNPDYLAAAKAVDNLEPDQTLGGVSSAPNGLEPFNLTNQASYENLGEGFFAQAYVEISTGNVIIAYDDSSIIPNSEASSRNRISTTAY